MDPSQIPPIINPSEEPPKSGVPRWRWWIHLAILTSLPLLVGILSLVRFEKASAPVLPGTVPDLLVMCLRELGFFAVLFGLAWLASRASARQLMLQWRGGGRPVVWGFGYSIILRVGVLVVIAAVVGSWLALTAAVTGVHETDPMRYRPRIDHLVDAGAMNGNPLYTVLLTTLVSFVVAGFREELWRAGMLAAIGVLFPRVLLSFQGRAAAVLAVAVLFGLGHTAQGLAGVFVAALLGAGLGAIMLIHRSIWEAVLAHGFFDASTFLLLHLLARFIPAVG